MEDPKLRGRQLRRSGTQYRGPQKGHNGARNRTSSPPHRSRLGNRTSGAKMCPVCCPYLTNRLARTRAARETALQINQSLKTMGSPYECGAIQFAQSEI